MLPRNPFVTKGELTGPTGWIPHPAQARGSVAVFKPQTDLFFFMQGKKGRNIRIHFFFAKTGT